MNNTPHDPAASDKHAVCGRLGCSALPTGLIAVTFYTPPRLFGVEASRKKVHQLILGMGLCEEHLAEVEANGVYQLLTEDAVELFAREVERVSGREVDSKACTVARVQVADQVWLKIDDLVAQQRRQAN